MNRLKLSLLAGLFLLNSLVLATNSTCSNYGTCKGCLGADNDECFWCSADSSCIDNAKKSSSCSTEQISTCEQDYYTIIFIIVLSGMICLCCGTCYLRKMRRQRSGEPMGLLAPLLPNSTRNYFFGNTSVEREGEWMCIICGFDNKARSKDCTMCGTSHQFTRDYKSNKKERKEQKKMLKEQQQKLQKKGILGDKRHDIPIPDEAQITSISMSLKFGNSSAFKDALSPQKRQEAMNYRRMNQLTLRQKSARRRKMWQRKMDPKTGQMFWVRVPIQETKVGSAPFGYTPRNSISASDGDDGLSHNTLTQPPNAIAQGNSGNVVRDLVSAHNSRGVSPVPRSPMSPKERKKRNISHDSFGDTTLVSRSPGFTSVFDEEGGLRWEKVETGQAVQRNVTRTSAIYNMITMRHSSLQEEQIQDLSNPVANDEEAAITGGGVPQFDLEAVAAMTFREKQTWFLDRMCGLQTAWSEGYVKIEVRRSHVLQDTFQAIASLKVADLHKWVRIQFSGEPGVDAGGLEREWFGLVTDKIFAPESGLFTFCGSDSAAGAYHINPTSGETNRNHLNYFKFVGRFFGKAIMEQQSLKANLSLPLRKQILGIPITFSDLEFVDDELFRNLCWMQENDVSSLMLDFSIAYAAQNSTVTYNLKPNGADVIVTDDNKDEYLQLRLRHRMLDSIKPQLEQFMTGIYEVVPPDLLSVFDYQELDLLLCGVPEIDLTDWMRNTEYLGEYNRLGARHTVIRWFWRSVETMTPEERTKLLQFTTGCSRLPAQGFKALQSNDGKYRKFNIQSIPKTDSIYPRAHTCFNKLDLPLYDSEAELEAYLSVVVNMEVTGFHME